MKKLQLAIAALLLVTLAVAAVGYASPSTRALLNALVLHPASVEPRHQGIIGNVTMDFWAVVCTTKQSVPETGADLTIVSNNGKTLVVPLNWTLYYPCIHTASFLVDLNPGTYSVTLSPVIQCYKPQPGGSQGGITCNLPFTVEVKPGTYSHVVLGVGGGV